MDAALLRILNTCLVTVHKDICISTSYHCKVACWSPYDEQTAILLKITWNIKMRIGGENFKVTVAFKNLRPESYHFWLNGLSKSDCLFTFGSYSSFKQSHWSSRWTWFFHPHPLDPAGQSYFLRHSFYVNWLDFGRRY